MSWHSLRIYTSLIFVLLPATIVAAQIQTPTEARAGGSDQSSQAWPVAESTGWSNRKVFVVTFDRPNRLQSCHIESLTADGLACRRALGATSTYLRSQIVALILPGDAEAARRTWLGINAGLAAAIWGTVVLVTICPVCAAVTAVVALGLFCAAGAVMIGDDQPNRLLYLAPGQQLSRRLGFVQGS